MVRMPQTIFCIKLPFPSTGELSRYSLDPDISGSPEFDAVVRPVYS